MNSLKLLGHDCPLRSYPGPVVPIGMLNNELVALYYSKDETGKPIIEKLPADCKFIEYSNPDSLPSFDLERDRLFAFGPEKLQVYPTRLRPAFYQKLLQDPDFCKNNP